VKTALYRHFDADGMLLYLGISLNSVARTAQHRACAHWFRDIARIAIEWHDTREAAEGAERAAIRNERPMHNVVHARGLPRRVRVGSRPLAQTQGPWAVCHAATGKQDGWYAQRETAEHMLGWFQAMFPRDQFRLIERSASVGSGPVLRTSEHASWAASLPDYAAADAYDANGVRL